jgi:hypothetical protein
MNYFGFTLLPLEAALPRFNISLFFMGGLGLTAFF